MAVAIVSASRQLVAGEATGVRRVGFFERLAQLAESFPDHPPMNFEDLIEFAEVVADVRQAEVLLLYDPAGWFLRRVVPSL